jgi:hypothetical protein
MIERIAATIVATLILWFVWWFFGSLMLLWIASFLGPSAIEPLGLFWWLPVALIPAIAWRILRRNPPR